MPRDVDSFVLDVLKQDETLKMSIFEQKELVSTLRHYSQLSFSGPAINKLCRETSRILNNTNRDGFLDENLLGELKKTGQLLWDHLLTRPVKDRLKASQVAELSLSLDEELISIPWELLFDGKDFLCLKFNLGRVVRTRESVSPVRLRGSGSRLRMLVLANPTDDLESAYKEGVHIKNQFERKRKEISIDFKSTRIDTFYVKKNLHDYDIVHFAGHCEYDTDNIGRSGWLFEDGRFTIQDILSLGDTISLPFLVFSNACHSAKGAPTYSDTDCQAKAYSLASAFLFSGVRHYIGTIRKIEDPASPLFAREFYSSLISGRPIGEALRLARLRLIKEHGLGLILWASYLLYGDAKFTLFKAKHKQEAARLEGAVTLVKKNSIRVFLVASVAAIIIYSFTLLPTLNPSAYFLFFKAQKSFKEGKNSEVIRKARGILAKDPGFPAIYPLLGDTYERLGKRSEALKYYFDYAYFSEKRQDKKNLASAYIGIGWVYHLTGDYPKAFEFYNKAEALARENKDRLNEAVALRKLAVWHIDKEGYDKALELLMKSSEINRERQRSSGHRYNLACDYFDIGLIFANKDDIKGAREFYMKSQKIFESLKLNDELSDCHFNLGEIFLFEKQYRRALESYFRGLEIDQRHGDKPGIAGDYEMIGELYKEMGNFEEAEKYFHKSLAVSREIEAPLELASASYSLGLLYKEKGYKNKAREYWRQAQEIYYPLDTQDYQDIKKELLELNNAP